MPGGGCHADWRWEYERIEKLEHVRYEPPDENAPQEGTQSFCKSRFHIKLLRQSIKPRSGSAVIDELAHYQFGNLQLDLAKRGISWEARSLELHRESLLDGPGRSGHDQDPIAQHHRFLDGMRHHDDGLAGLIPDPSK